MIFVTTADITRPANATVYTAGDHITGGTAAALDFSVLMTGRGAGRVESVLLRKSAANATNATFTLHLYTVEPTAAADNAAQTLPLDGWVGAVALDLSSGAQTLTTGLAERIAVSSPIYFEKGVSPRSIYGLLLAGAAYTPGSAETFHIELGVEA